LRAIALGLELRWEPGESWHFAGFWQDPRSSRVPDDIVASLSERGLLALALTTKGTAVLSRMGQTAIDEATQWLKKGGLGLSI
jgi:hypothetical protein